MVSVDGKALHSESPPKKIKGSQRIQTDTYKLTANYTIALYVVWYVVRKEKPYRSDALLHLNLECCC